MTSEQLKALHAAVYRNTGQDPMWLGYWLKQFVESEDSSWSELAQELGVSSDRLVLLCLCRTPRADHFQEDLRVVCERTGAREESVARIVRQEQAMMRWRENPPSASTGWLLAASDGDDSTGSDQSSGAEDDED
jgi:hypothetical protein